MPRKPRSVVVVYGIAGSEKCRAITDFLESQGVAFTEKDVLESEKAMRDLAVLTGGRAPVPVVVIGGRILCDPTPRLLARALRNVKV